MKLKIKASKSYNVIIENGYQNLPHHIKKVVKNCKVMVVTDDNVSPLYYEQLKNGLTGLEVFWHVIKHGESSKNAENYLEIINAMAKNRFNRKDCVLALGGGVVGDLAGFSAATYMRGVKFIQCPTTLLSMVDSSVGGKTGIDISAGKNLVGAFYQPSLVYVNLDTLESLPEREIECGLGEIVKCAYLTKKVTKEDIIEKNYKKLISECLKYKAMVVKKDEFEKHLRMFLNLGHTVGHAIESLDEYKNSHGLCVIKGIYKIIEVSAKYYGLTEQKKNELLSLLYLLGLDKSKLLTEYTPKQLKDKILSDKKSQGKFVNFILIKDIAKCEIVKIDVDKIEGFLA